MLENIRNGAVWNKSHDGVVKTCGKCDWPLQWADDGGKPGSLMTCQCRREKSSRHRNVNSKRSKEHADFAERLSRGFRAGEME